ncbi:hypothetical protein JCM24511_05827 [Saitozyma sp. JCM 24511]|nr:hypothetical protein JCM24511_05827 [Saitozyma sp. JCM 24511]
MGGGVSVNVSPGLGIILAFAIFADIAPGAISLSQRGLVPIWSVHRSYDARDPLTVTLPYHSPLITTVSVHPPSKIELPLCGLSPPDPNPPPSPPFASTFSHTGGWWSRPKNWAGNTVFAIAGIALATYGVWTLSARKEERHIAPWKPIPSARWSPQAKEIGVREA